MKDLMTNHSHWGGGYSKVVSSSMAVLGMVICHV
nr:MAG TPA: hypothetical protein [Caudoviricetes sp.]